MNPFASDREFFSRVFHESKDPEWVAQISAQLLSAFDLLRDITNGVSVFGSARTKEGTPEYQTGVEVGRALSEAGFDVITGGGPGMMEAGNRGANEAGGKSIGLGMELHNEQGFNEYVTLPVQFEHFFVRKVAFVKYSKAFVTLPGGFGTLDELFETLTLIQTEKIRNFPVVLFGTEYWSGLVEWLQNSMQPGGYINQIDIDRLLITDSLDEMLAFIHEELHTLQQSDELEKVKKN